eukprot:704218-Alexandrium_andersonii.AAC.1
MGIVPSRSDSGAANPDHSQRLHAEHGGGLLRVANSPKLSCFGKGLELSVATFPYLIATASQHRLYRPNRPSCDVKLPGR